MDVLSKCTIVRAIGRSAYRLETTKEWVVETEATLSAVLKTLKKKKRLYSMSVKLPIKPVNLICVRKPVKQTVKTPEEKKNCPTRQG